MKRISIPFVLLLTSVCSFCQKPVADFEVLVNYGCQNASTEFKNLSINADSFLWDTHGNGVFYNLFEPRGTNISGDRSWIVTLIAQGNGYSDTLSKQVDIFQTKLNFGYSVSNTDLFAPLNVSFNNRSEIRDEDTLIYSWDFGDGSYSEDENPTHIYSEPGTYFVQLKGTNFSGCSLRFDDYVVVKDTLQKEEFSFINSGCYGENEDPPCDWEKHYRRSGDSLIIFGGYSGNCGTTKTATKSFNGDTIYITTWECGPHTTCSCIYCIEFAITGIAQDSVVVVFNNEVLSTIASGIDWYEKNNPELCISPNPVKNVLIVDGLKSSSDSYDYEIFDVNGRIVLKGNLENNKQICLQNLNTGTYIIRVVQKSENKEFLARFLKNEF
ncbi:MAG TPA: PKD domain-containing protein [Prolixibacteraceae bacterium]|nr:PKD domain-containing protein [Prolixibacteraceae bacterium]